VAEIAGAEAPENRNDAEDIARWARLALTALLVVLGWRAFHDEYGAVPLVSGINLAVHELGHMLFMPFGFAVLGETMVILGGSLTQIAFPLIFVAYFLRARKGRRDVFASMVCLWWAAINVLGVAIYCNDARAGVLMLISGETGQESDAHDWNNLLTRWGALNQDHAIADVMRRMAWLMFVVSIGVCSYVAWRRSVTTTADHGARGEH
jgi:hypothetical protein